MSKEAKAGTLVFRFEGPSDAQEWLVAELGDLGFGAFSEAGHHLLGYVSEFDWSREAEGALGRVLSTTGFRQAGVDRITPANWSARWESGIDPVRVDSFFIHPPWHEPSREGVSICIEPKMSFGTAHHETTRLVLGVMADLVRPGHRVLDAGAGTAILAIAARKLGSRHVVAFDIDPWSLENAKENVVRNEVDGVDLHSGGIEKAGEGPFDVILANINRNALLEMMSSFALLMAREGRLVVSGILQRDGEAMEKAFNESGLVVVDQRAEGDWIALVGARTEEQ